jgi:hypothetical protein
MKSESTPFAVWKKTTTRAKLKVSLTFRAFWLLLEIGGEHFLGQHNSFSNSAVELGCLCLPKVCVPALAQ